MVWEYFSTQNNETYTENPFININTPCVFVCVCVCVYIYIYIYTFWSFITQITVFISASQTLSFFFQKTLFDSFYQKLYFFEKLNFILHFLKLPFFQKAEFEKAEPNSP